jgi:hypothetical protein
MDLNLELLLILLGVGFVFGVGGAVFMSESVRRYGLMEVLRRALSTGPGRNPYAH